MPLFAPFPGFASAAQMRARAVSNVAVSPALMLERAQFRASLSADQTGIASSTATAIALNQEAFDNGGYFDIATGRWTPPSGPVRLSGNLQAVNVTAGNVAYALLLKNGSIIAECGGVCVSGVVLANADIVDVANGTDYYQLGVIGVTGTTITISSPSYLTYFCGEQV